MIDDDDVVLIGLKGMLRSANSRWDVRTASDGESALAELDSGFFSVVVSDIQMPGMDGVQVLEEVRKRSPETVRIALSGHVGKDETLRAATQIHQFLSKPCDPETLRAALTQAMALSELLTDRKLRALVANMTSLPSMDSLHRQVVEELESSDVSVSQVGVLIGRDAAMTTKVLQLVNSALVGLPNLVTSPVQAAALLGLDTLRTLILTIKIFESYRGADLGGLSLEGMWNHSVHVARLAKRLCLAELADEETSQRAFLAGLLHDVGKLAIATNFPSEFRSAQKRSKEGVDTLLEEEARLIGANHQTVGAYLMGLWGFSNTIIEAIAHHHTPSRGLLSGFTPLTAVHVANGLVHEAGAPAFEGDSPYLDGPYLERFSFLDRLPVWREMCSEMLDGGSGIE